MADPSVRSLQPDGTLPSSAPGMRIQTKELMRLMLDSLQCLGYAETAATLSRESGVTLPGVDMAHFRMAVLDGKWHDTWRFLPQVPLLSTHELPSIVFALSRQQFLEALESGDAPAALQVLQHQLVALCEQSPDGRDNGITIPSTDRPGSALLSTVVFSAKVRFPQFKLHPGQSSRLSAAPDAAVLSPFQLMGGSEAASGQGSGVISAGGRLPGGEYAHEWALCTHRRKREGGIGMRAPQRRTAARAVQSDASRVHAGTSNPQAASAHDDSFTTSATAVDWERVAGTPSKRMRHNESDPYSSNHATPAADASKADTDTRVPSSRTLVIAGTAFELPRGPAALASALPWSAEECRLLGATQAGEMPAVLGGSQLPALATLLLLTSGDSLRSQAQWDGAAGGSRRALLRFIERRLSSDIVPPLRLAALLGQALSYQYSMCAFHHSHESAPTLLRDHECRHESLPARCCVTLEGHEEEVWGMAVSPDASRFASFSCKGELCTWDLRALRALVAAKAAKGAALADCKLARWTAAGTCNAEVQSPTSASGEQAGVAPSCVVWDPEGQPNIATCDANTSTICIWDSSTGTLLGRCETGLEGGLIGVVWLPTNGSISAAASGSGMASPSAPAGATGRVLHMVAGGVDGGIVSVYFTLPATLSEGPAAVGSGGGVAADHVGAPGTSLSSTVRACHRWYSPPLRSIATPHTHQDIVVALTQTGVLLVLKATSVESEPLLEQHVANLGYIPSCAVVDSTGRYALIAFLGAPPVPHYRPGMVAHSASRHRDRAAVEAEAQSTGSGMLAHPFLGAGPHLTRMSLAAAGSGASAHAHLPMSEWAPVAGRIPAVMLASPGRFGVEDPALPVHTPTASPASPATQVAHAHADAGLTHAGPEWAAKWPKQGALLELWDMVSATVVQSFAGHVNRRCVIPPTIGGTRGSLIAIGDELANIHIWHRGRGEAVQCLTGHAGTVSCLAWADDSGSALLSAADDGLIKLWLP